ncbi:MAG: hypothetical protein HY721_34455 [Planctomycetes bacterium]|nr:hypothetical protein [Planctomycetota bacterium]
MSETLRPVIEAAKAGDKSALNTLARCVDRFVRVFSGKLSQSLRRSQGSTIDFVLEGLAEAFARLGELEYRSDEEFYAWAARHIRHRLASAGRAEGRKKRAGRPQGLGEKDELLEGDEPSPSRLVSDEEVRAALGRAIVEAQLEHPEAMEVVLAKVFEEKSWSEVVEELGLSSMKRARTLFALGVDVLRPRVEKALGRPALWEFLGL